MANQKAEKRLIKICIRGLDQLHDEKDVAWVEDTLIHLKQYVFELYQLETIVNQYANKYDGPKWYSIANKIIDDYARREQRYIHETSKEVRDLIMFPSKWLMNWDSFYAEKVKLAKS